MPTTEEKLAQPRVVDVTLRPTKSPPTEDQALWSAIRNRTDAIAFNRYDAFIQRVLESPDDDNGNDVDDKSPGRRGRQAVATHTTPSGVRMAFSRRPIIQTPDAYHLLKFATYAFLACESGVAVKFGPDEGLGSVVPGEDLRLGEEVTYGRLHELLNDYLQQQIGGVKGNAMPYMKRVVGALLGPTDLKAYGELLRRRVESPSLLELIWCYWHEEGMLAQSINTISLRFQNQRQGVRDPLAALEIDPLRPLSNLMWGFIQDEINRLSVARRAHEYRHAYGLTMIGKAVGSVTPADDRPRFIEAFHNLLRRAIEFYREDADTTIVSDAFALLNSLKELHVILAEGAHNQFGEMPTTARAEMLMMQWLLARPELQQFLGGRMMVPYQEPWMRQVDTLKRLKGWTDVGVNHFRDLGVFGEKLLLSIRYGDWIDVTEQEHARNWARYWKSEVQGYVHAYLAATGVDLTVIDVGDSQRLVERNLQPSVHLRQRLIDQQSRLALTNGNGQQTALLEHGAPRASVRTPVLSRRVDE